MANFAFRLGVLMGATLVCVPFLSAQEKSAGAALLETGAAQFALRCAGCHGADAGGTDHAPALAGNRRLRSRSTEQIGQTIRNGVPSSGMPAFDLPKQQLESLGEFVHSLNSAAADSALPGDREAGREVFLRTGNCSSCHMVFGAGAAIGPDLSNVGSTMTVAELKRVLSHPETFITPGYQLVNVRLKNGTSLRGFARGRTNFDIQVQDFQGNFHLLTSKEVASISDEPGSVMKPFAGSETERTNLIAYLGSLNGKASEKSPPAAEKSTSGTNIDFARLLHPKPGDWLTYNGTLDANRSSSLHQIDKSNVGQLGLRWIFPIPHFGLEATPLVADGVMYVTGPNQAYALDAATGRVIWKYSRPVTRGLVGDASLGTNRGVALYSDKVFMVTDNAHLLALNRVTGSLVWDTYMPEEPQHYGSTIAPLIINDTVLAGVSGGDWGMRGFIACFRASTGELLWRHWTIPLKGDPGLETWKGKEPLYGGGSTWLTGSYDPETDTVYWPTGNPWPDSDDRDRPGDNLFTDCILALNPHDGKLKWHFQFTPHDIHDRDANEPPVLVDTEYRGKPRKLLLHADRNGFFYVLDRTSGEVLLARKFLARVNWASGIGPDHRPQTVGGEKEQRSREMGCPSNAANWSSTSYSSVTGFYYVMTQEDCQPPEKIAAIRAGNMPDEPGYRYLRAINIDDGAVAWEVKQIGPVLAKTWPGVLGTASGLLFYGDPNGTFVAADERDGKTLWHFDTNVVMKASPMTYIAGGRQFVAITAGSDVLSFALP
ncbi:MAG: PQQ-binding-like beta-propeller repeat protein [Bryobacteraceae bacterium]